MTETVGLRAGWNTTSRVGGNPAGRVRRARPAGLFRPTEPVPESLPKWRRARRLNQL
jgi:hypothetical protein